MDDRKLNITLLCGGVSAEREISLMTGTQIAEALRTVGHRVWQSDIAPENLAALDRRPCDLVFPALHGAFGEDGALQEILEARGIPFVGSGSAASRTGMDKAATKSLLLEHGIPTANWQVVYAHKYKDSWTPASGIGYPCVIKPVSEGSSVGCRVCRTLEEARGHLAASLPRRTPTLPRPGRRPRPTSWTSVSRAFRPRPMVAVPVTSASAMTRC